MEQPSTPNSSSRPARSRRRGARSSRSLGLTPLFDPGIDRSALERMLMALAVHPSGAGFQRAHFFVWNVDRMALEGRLSWARPSGRRALSEALLAANRHATDGTDLDGTRRLRSISLAREDLDGALATAWAGGTSALGEGPRSGGYLWRPGSPVGAVALHGSGRGYGLIVGEWDDPGDAIERAAAIEALRRTGDAALRMHSESEEARRRARQSAALGELATAAVSPLNLAEFLGAITRLAAQGTGARGAALWVVGERHAPKLESTWGPAGTRERLGRALRPLAVAALERGRRVVLERVTDDARLSPEAAAQLSALAVLPMQAHGRNLGALAVYDRAAFHPADSMAFDPVDLEFLTTLCHLCALVLERAEEGDRLLRGDRERQDLTRRLARSERLAALGELAARMSKDARNPLASIGAFARRAHRHLADDDPGREYLEVVMREAERLERMMSEQSKYTALGTPRLKLESLNAVIQSTLQQQGEALVRRRVRLLKKLSPDVPPLLLDSERIGRVMENILAHALETVAPGGRIRVESRRVHHHVVVDVANDGVSAPGELLSQLFVPFALNRQGGPAIGLAVARQIVQQHGGEIRVRSEGEWATIFSFTLPVRENEDRRHSGNNRRVSQADRRERFPVA